MKRAIALAVALTACTHLNESTRAAPDAGFRRDKPAALAQARSNLAFSFSGSARPGFCNRAARSTSSFNVGMSIE